MLQARQVSHSLCCVPAGVQYTDGSDVNDHGGFSNDDLNVGLLIAVPGATNKTVTRNVTSTQVGAARAT